MKRNLKSEKATVKRVRPEMNLYSSFMNFVLEPPMRDLLKQTKRARVTNQRSMPGLGPVTEFSGVQIEPPWDCSITPAELGWNERLRSNFSLVSEPSSTQQSILEVVGRYSDLQAITVDLEYRNIYLAHILNHLVCSRNTIIRNKQKLVELQAADNHEEDELESLRDQGFARPIVLIMCPMKKDAYDIVQRLRRLIYGDDEKQDVWAKQRFETEYYSASADNLDVELDEENKYLVTGNNDDCFRLGISLTKRTLKLFEPFDKSDIILCSPLGIRMILNGEEGTESHLVANLQVVVIDKADVLLQQNWEHLNLIFSHIGSQPSQIDTDISRVKQLYLDGDAKHYTQLLMFSKYHNELFSALIMEHSLNYRGLVVHQPPCEGNLENILIPLCQELHRFDVPNIEELSDARFKFFTDKFVCLSGHTCIVVPSYYDFVRVRNHLKRMEESFVSCYEYAPKAKIARARDLFYNDKKNVLLITERYYFFNRSRIRGIQEMIFYQLPSHPELYYRMINMAQPKEASRMKVSLLYCKYDRMRMYNVFGEEMTNAMLKSTKRLHAIVSE